MTEVLDQTPETTATPAPEAPSTDELIREVHHVLSASPDPLTLSKIRSHLPTAHRSVDLKLLEESLLRLVEANVLYQYPAYRSPHHRYWDRSMPYHVAAVVRDLLEEEPLAWPQLKRKLPGYIDQDQAKQILEEQLGQGKLFEHPATGARTGKRYGVAPPNPKDYLRKELPNLFQQLEQMLGVSRTKIREAAIELLHEEEWESVPATAAEEESPEPTPQPEQPA